MSDQPNKATHEIAAAERERVLAEICRLRSLGHTQASIDEYYQGELDQHAVAKASRS